MLKAIKIRLYPNEEQINYINNLLGCSRFVYNNCLAYKIKKYEKSKESVSFGDLGEYLVEIKNKEGNEWLKDAHSKVLQQSLINLDKAYKNFFKNGAGFPKFKSKHAPKQSCRFPKDAIGKVFGNRINIIKKLSDIHFKCSRRDEKILNKFQKSIKSGTLTRTKSGKFYFSILMDLPYKQKLPKSDKIVGIDAGINDFIVGSDGKRYDNLKIMRKNQKKLSRLQKNISRKKKDSNNRNKARIKLARFHEKLNNQKDHYLHQVSNEIINENQVIVIEDLDVVGMMKNKYLARSVQELSLFRFREILSYKSDWRGRELIQIDRYFPSSKLCNCCGYKNEELELKDREWKCSNCGAIHDRDFNAAKNILKEGQRILKLGLSSPEVTLGETGGCAGRRTKKKMIS